MWVEADDLVLVNLGNMDWLKCGAGQRLLTQTTLRAPEEEIA